MRPPSRRPAFLLVVACLLSAVTWLLPSCARRESPAAEGRRTRTLLIGNQNEPATLDPQLVDAYTDDIILAALFEGLTVIDERTSKPLPGVAERWDVTPDGLTYTFHLRADARWSNGDPVTAGDFAFSFQRILTPAFGANYSYMLWPIKNAEAFNKGKIPDFSAVGIQVLDDHTLRLHLERPTPYLPALATHNTWMPVHRANLEKYGRIDDRANPWSLPGHLVSNGAFTLSEWSPNARVVVTKNPDYWDAAHTWLNRVIFFPTENADTEERNYRAGQLHITYDVPKSKIPAYRAQSPSPLRVDPLFNLIYLNFNVTKPPFTDARVRRAFALAVDRETLSHDVLFGAYAPAHSIVPPDCGGYTSRAGVPTDYDEARRLLAEAGFPGGKGFPTIPVQVLNDEAEPRIMETLQAAWQRELGIRITIEPYEQKTWLQNQRTLSHTLGVLGWTADFADPITFLDLFRSGNGNNWTGWADPAYDALLDRAANTADPQARFEIFQKAEAYILQAAPVAPLFYHTRTYLMKPYVQGWPPSPIGLHRFQLVHFDSQP
ncbi:MAG TPA: peptide ABC transporter substrate-binding protein [Opitutus sp.]|nr:peptide ABC transporter substrate-binding protein [Opitutus sp.]